MPHPTPAAVHALGDQRLHSGLQLRQVGDGDLLIGDAIRVAIRLRRVDGGDGVGLRGRVEEADKLKYTDVVGLLMSSITTIINAISHRFNI